MLNRIKQFETEKIYAMFALVLSPVLADFVLPRSLNGLRWPSAFSKDTELAPILSYLSQMYMGCNSEWMDSTDTSHPLQHLWTHPLHLNLHPNLRAPSCYPGFNHLL